MQNRKVFSSIVLNFGSNIDKCSHKHRVSVAAPLIMAQSWPRGSQVADKNLFIYYIYIYLYRYTITIKIQNLPCRLLVNVLSRDEKVTSYGFQIFRSIMLG